LSSCQKLKTAKFSHTQQSATRPLLASAAKVKDAVWVRRISKPF
jgi:hypothetical protein